MFTVTASERSCSSSTSATSSQPATPPPPPPPLMALPASVTSLEVIDPCNRTGKIHVPMTHVAETAGVVDFHLAPERRQGKELSLCLLFQRGRCNAGARCHQVHAAPEYVALLREQAASTRNCCADHGDMHSSGSFAALIAESVAVVDASTGSVARYAIGSFARTSCLDAVLRGARRGVEPRVPAAKVCRLHAQGRCKFGKDCRNIHLCPAAATLGSSSSSSVLLAAPIAVPAAPVVGSFFLPAPPPLPPLAACCGPKPFPAPVASLSVSHSDNGGSSSCGSSTPSHTPRMQPAAYSAPRRFGAAVAPPTPVTIHVAAPAPIGDAAAPSSSTVKPLSLWSCEGFGLLAGGTTAAAAADAAHNSGFFGSERSFATAAADDSLAAARRKKAEEEEMAGLDMSAFEATLKSLCDDLARADFSPAAAQRSNPLFA